MSSDGSRRRPHGGNDSAALDAALETFRQADVLVAGPASGGIASWLATQFNHNFDAYDRAIDAVYNATHVGGSAYHHLLDGQHTIWGALEAVQGVQADHSFAADLVQAGEHLLRDTMSVSGVNPFLSPSAFESMAAAGDALGISRAYIADAVTLNGAELLGGCIALAASVVVGRKADPCKLSSLSGCYVISALASGNPLLLSIAAGGLTYSLLRAENKKEVLVQGGKGALVSGSALLVSSLVGGPVWLGCAAAVLTGITVKYALDHQDRALRRVEQVTSGAAVLLKQASNLIRENGRGPSAIS